ncbi:MAG: VOC family protein [Gammaproteobacteria bacterium]|nr:VOC family protein [Gammaproteobacteria bacterium]
MAKGFLQILTVAALAFATSAFGADDGRSDDSGSDASLAQVAINVADLDRSEKYYRDVLGFTRVWQYPPDSEAPIEIGLAAPGGGAGLVLARLSDEPLPEGKGRYGRIIVNTANAKKLAAKAEAAGSKPRFVTIPGDNPPTIVFFRDPDGYEIELYQGPSP